jgi:hypothetical protein
MKYRAFDTEAEAIAAKVLTMKAQQLGTIGGNKGINLYEWRTSVLRAPNADWVNSCGQGI